ncbi:MAG: phytanoyl-CoA dioxygenase family protein [Bacteroidetes bacterium]|nr:phytanoyl-CoA dioxygenase family protein [Bacteroidota bacterium]
MLFKDEKLQRQFDLQGYVVVPFLPGADVEELRHLFFASYPEPPPGFYSSSFDTDELRRTALNEKITAVLDRYVPERFGEIRKLGSCFLNKQPGAGGEMPIHQDWTVTDEPAHDSVTIWIPLQDTDETNGAIQVIEGSHRFSGALRAPTLPDPFREVQDELRQDLTLLRMKAGEAFIFSHALLHASPPNTGASARIAVTYGLTAADAPLLFYHHEAGAQTDRYGVEADFFQRYNRQIGSRPDFGRVEASFDYQQRFVTAEEYRQMKLNFLHQKSEAMYKMKPIFRDSAKQAFFEKEGYAVFPLLGADEIDELKQYYLSKHIRDDRGFGFHVSMDQADKEMCREIREKIWGIVVPRLSEHLEKFKPFVASYVVKEVNPKGVVPAHQDWSFADREEDGYCSITCWIALVDTNIDNGGMGVIKGSHKFMMNHRPSPSPQCPVPLSDHMFSIFPYLHTIDMKAGEVLMFDNRTFHASPPNVSDSVRLAVGVGVTQEDADLVHYYMRPDGTFRTMLRYNVDTDFYLKYNNSALASLYDSGGVIEGYGAPTEVPYDFTRYTTDELLEVMKAAGNTFNIPMTEKLAKIFGNMSAPQEQKQEDPATVQAPDTAIAEPQPEPPQQWVDTRTFAEKYTLKNIAKEIKMRLVGA